MPDYTHKLNQKTWEAFDSDTELGRAIVFSEKSEPAAMIKVRLFSRLPFVFGHFFFMLSLQNFWVILP
jgi:hypothetical protein